MKLVRERFFWRVLLHRAKAWCQGQSWLACNEDLKDLYQVHQGSCSGAMLPTTLKGNRHSPDAEEESESQKQAQSSHYEKFTDKMMEVEAVEVELWKKYADAIYTEYLLHGHT